MFAISRTPGAIARCNRIGRRRNRSGGQGQSVVEFALLLPILIALLLGAIDFGRIMQARVTSESAAKAGAHWGASHLQNATQGVEPAYGLTINPKNCGSGTKAWRSRSRSTKT